MTPRRFFGDHAKCRLAATTQCNGYRGPLETYVCDRDCRIDYTEMTACTCRRNNGYGCDLHGIPFTAEAVR